MDTQDQELQIRTPGRKQRRRTIQERREIVEETLVAGASVSRVARRHDVNANQVFYWRKLYREGQLGGDTDHAAAAGEGRGMIDRESRGGVTVWRCDRERWRSSFRKGTLRISGAVDVVALRAVLECLVG